MMQTMSYARGASHRGCDFMVAGTFHVPSAVKKTFVFGATALGVCLLLCSDSIKSQPLRERRLRTNRRRAFTLLELILSMALAAVVAGLMGSLVQIFLVNQERGQDSVRQAQLARAVLNMIAEDIRTTVRYQPFDTSGLEQLLSSGGGAGGGGGAPSGGGPPPGGSGAPLGGGAPSAGSAPSGGGGSAGGGAPASGGSPSASSVDTSMTTVPPPPGLYGTSTSIEIDVSRLPRPDEYYPQMSDPLSGSLGDMPSDIKTVGYYVQSPRPDGVQDPFAALSQQATTANGASSTPSNGGLVRRSVDRAVTQYAYENGRSDQLLKTGQIVAPEVMAIEFQYFDGTQWLAEWDGSQQGLPHVVKITIAMQRYSFTMSKPITQGIPISSLTTDMMQEFGIEIFSTNTTIPGAQLLAPPQGTSGSSDNGMGSLGL